MILYFTCDVLISISEPCLDDCSTHGYCNTTAQECTCFAKWTNPSCSDAGISPFPFSPSPRPPPLIVSLRPSLRLLIYSFYFSSWQINSTRKQTHRDSCGFRTPRRPRCDSYRMHSVVSYFQLPLILFLVYSVFIVD